MSRDRPPGSMVDLAGLADRYGLTARQVAQLDAYAGILAYDDLAPTTVRDPASVRDDHIADSLVALELAWVRQSRVLADIGAGAGLPGLVLAVALPNTSVSVLEGNSRKCEFMRRVVTTIGLSNVSVVHGRAETWTVGMGTCDLVTARALAPLDVVEEYAAPLLRIGGRLMVWRGRRDADAEADGARAAEILGLAVSDPVPVRPYHGAEHRHLHVFTKRRETPSRFPRRDGVARKRPLGRL